MPATPQDRLYGLTTSVAVKPPVYISADYDITRFGEQTITSKTPTDERTITTTEGMRVLLLGQDNPSKTVSGLRAVRSGSGRLI
ncbi:endo-N-acetylneuraminidase [Klebsiella michiganensis]|nr:endo-N-acetylneuraminidase [Klebsiella michiganensis]